MKNPYQVLGVSADASEDEIRSAYREKAAALGADRYIGKELPPDIAIEMKELDEAYDTVISLRRLRGDTRRNYSSDPEPEYSDAPSTGTGSDTVQKAFKYLGWLSIALYLFRLLRRFF